MHKTHVPVLSHLQTGKLQPPTDESGSGKASVRHPQRPPVHIRVEWRVTVHMRHDRSECRPPSRCHNVSPDQIRYLCYSAAQAGCNAKVPASTLCHSFCMTATTLTRTHLTACACVLPAVDPLQLIVCILSSRLFADAVASPCVEAACLHCSHTGPDEDHAYVSTATGCITS